MERFLSVSLPDYVQESTRLGYAVLITTPVFLVLLPFCCALGMPSGKPTESKAAAQRKMAMGAAIGYAVGIVGWIAAILLFVLERNSYNTFLPGRVFVAPVLTASECRTLVRFASQAAQSNFQTYLQTRHDDKSPNKIVAEFVQEPLGWHKDGAPAAFLHPQDDPFVNQTVVHQLLDQRLLPLLQKVYGTAHLQANDLYWVYYTEGQGQQPAYTDFMGDVTFQIVLYNDDEAETDNNDDKETATGGGIRFANLVQVQPNVGDVVFYSATLPREDIPGGTRIVLLGNLSVRPPSLWSALYTNASSSSSSSSWLASYGNIAWLWTRSQSWAVLSSSSAVAFHHPSRLVSLVGSPVAQWLQARLEAAATPVRVEHLVAPVLAASYLEALMEDNEAAVSPTGTTTGLSQWWRGDITVTPPPESTILPAEAPRDPEVSSSKPDEL